MSGPDASLPVDRDLQAAGTPIQRARPVHLSATNMGLVAGGGAVGTGLRYLVTRLIPSGPGYPSLRSPSTSWGAFLLGALLELLADRGLDAGRSRRVRLAVGTGGLGGFTTYSALATDTATLLTSHPRRAIAYGLGTVVVGAVASLSGIWLARRRHRSAPDGRLNRT